MERGSISDPNKFYHYEIVCKYEEDAEVLRGMLMFFGMDAKVIARKNSFIVYMKEGNNITLAGIRENSYEVTDIQSFFPFDE